MHLLVISEGFAPWGGPAAMRATKVAACALRSGWKVTVLCASERAAHGFDDHELAKEVVGADIIRVPNGTEYRARPTLARIGGWAVRVGDRALRRPRGAWVRDMVSAALDRLGASPPDLVFCTSPPPVALDVGVALTRRTHWPWIADFRDPPWGAQTSGAEAVLAEAVQDAALVVMNTPHAAEEARRRFPQADRKIICITNGIDASACDGAPDSVSVDPLEVVYAGGMYPWAFESIQPFLPMVAGGALRLIAYVFPEPKHQRRIASLRASGVDVRTPVPNAELPKLLRMSGASMCCMTEDRTASKAYLGIASGRPLLVYDLCSSVGGDRSLLELPGVFTYRSSTSADDLLMILDAARGYDPRRGWAERQSWLSERTWDRITERLLSAALANLPVGPRGGRP